jgi:hypothetical protein
MFLLSTAALFLLVNSLVSPAYACLDAGQVIILCFAYCWLTNCIVHRCDAAIGLGAAAHVGIGLGVGAFASCLHTFPISHPVTPKSNNR